MTKIEVTDVKNLIFVNDKSVYIFNHKPKVLKGGPLTEAETKAVEDYLKKWVV